MGSVALNFKIVFEEDLVARQPAIFVHPPHHDSATTDDLRKGKMIRF